MTHTFVASYAKSNHFPKAFDMFPVLNEYGTREIKVHTIYNFNLFVVISYLCNLIIRIFLLKCMLYPKIETPIITLT